MRLIMRANIFVRTRLCYGPIMPRQPRSLVRRRLALIVCAVVGIGIAAWYDPRHLLWLFDTPRRFRGNSGPDVPIIDAKKLDAEAQASARSARATMAQLRAREAAMDAEFNGSASPPPPPAH
jgi:hypothetical protein